MVFIRPRVLRTPEQAAFETNSKYNYLRDMQIERNGGKVKMMPGATQPTLPPLVGPTQTTPPPPPSNDEQDAGSEAPAGASPPPPVEQSPPPPSPP